MNRLHFPSYLHYILSCYVISTQASFPLVYMCVKVENSQSVWEMISHIAGVWCSACCRFLQPLLGEETPPPHASGLPSRPPARTGSHRRLFLAVDFGNLRVYRLENGLLLCEIRSHGQETWRSSVYILGRGVPSLLFPYWWALKCEISSCQQNKTCCDDVKCVIWHHWRRFSR